MAAVSAPRSMSPEEYFAWEEMQEVKHEYFYGEVFAMAGGTARHASLTINVATALSNALRGSGCRVFSGDLRIELAAGAHYVYPDLSVVCGEARFTSDRQTTLLNPTLVVEVLSRSTEAYDRGLKLAAYGRVASLREVVLVAQDRRSVEVFRPNDSGGWTTAGAAGGAIELASVGAALRLDEVYEGVTLPAVPPFPRAAEE